MDPVLAYLDPGTGSVILQALLGGIAGVALTLKLFGRRILSFFRRRPPSEPTPPAARESEVN
jgi:hypothetical protein